MTRLVGKIPFTTFTGPDRFRELVGLLRAVLDRPDLTRGDEAMIRFRLAHVLVLMEEHDAARAELPPGSVEVLTAMTYLGWPGDEHQRRRTCAGCAAHQSRGHG
jgi:hypothetical protein